MSEYAAPLSPGVGRAPVRPTPGNPADLAQGEGAGSAGCTATRHGTRAAYVAGCRCPDARKANREYAKYRDRRTAHAAHGGAAPFSVPVEQAREVVASLRAAGWSLRRIEAESGVRRDRLQRILGRTQRPVRRVRWATYQALTALTDRDVVVAGSALVDAGPTWRLLRGLIAFGYPKSYLARELGTGQALQLDQHRITARNAEKVRALADRLCVTRGPSDAARRYAAQRGWTPDLLWDDDEPLSPAGIDEYAVERAMHGDPVTLTRTEIDTAIFRLTEQGVSAIEIARRLRVNPRTVQRRRAREGVAS